MAILGDDRNDTAPMETEDEDIDGYPQWDDVFQPIELEPHGLQKELIKVMETAPPLEGIKDIQKNIKHDKRMPHLAPTTGARGDRELRAQQEKNELPMINLLDYVEDPNNNAPPLRLAGILRSQWEDLNERRRQRFAGNVLNLERQKD